MSTTGKNFYDRSKTQTGLLERIELIIPGFRGYKEKELRRESDKLVRNQMYVKLSEAESLVKDVYRSLVNQGVSEAWDDTDHLVARMDRITERINHSEYGYAGFFDAMKVKEPDLDRMMAFDDQLLQQVDTVTQAVAALKALEPELNGRMKTAEPGSLPPAVGAPKNAREIVDRAQIQTGAQLVVHEYESAVFLRDGKAYDVFTPGRHTLTTLNLPLISRAYGIFFGGKSPFTATVIFVATKQFAGKWGAKAQTTELAPLMIHGTFWFKITDANLFVNEVVGGQGAYTTGQVDDFLRGFINERVIDEMSKYDLTSAFTQLDKVSITVKVNIGDAIKRIGSDLVDFKFEGIDTSDAFRDRLFWIKQRASASDVLRMETAKDIGASVGQSPGAGFGAGFALIPQVMNAPMQTPLQAPAQPAVVMMVCPKCQSQIPQGTKFCPNCGSNVQSTNNCPNCGKPLAAGAKFCPECGQKI